MLRRRSALFLTFLLIGLLSFIYSSRALADLTYLASGHGEEVLGTKLILHPDPAVVTDVDLELELMTAQEIVTRRLDRLDLARPYYVTIQNDQLLVTLPDTENMTYVSSVIALVGKVEFIDGGSEAPPIGRQVKSGLQGESTEKIYQTLFVGQEVKEIAPPDLASGQIFYQVTLEPEAAARFANFVETRPGHYVCIVVDHEVISCSVMYHWSENTLEILPNLSSGSMVSLADLALFLESGPLPMSLTVQ